ncbi:MAG: beta-hydroxyacyl-ACP dehydratase [Sedimentisphaerales bacterium]|nr:beta-hydroxyacyl-ACP dehydratase [Sedimentisphaerales bacterium]
MRFILIDKIVKIEPGKEIISVKNVSLSEEYLADHFPTFPVLPGVFLLQGLIESASWLVRETENFAHSMVLLEQAKNVKYKSFAGPGSTIEYTVTAKSIEENASSFSGKGSCNGEAIVEARFSLRHFNLAEKEARLAVEDAYIINKLKERYKILATGINAT